MNRITVLCALTGALVAPALHAQSPAPQLYALSAPPSEYAWGCFGPCACPVFVQSEVGGTFVLTQTSVDPLFVNYNVSSVQWRMHSGSSVVSVTGSGTYRRGGEVAVQEQLALDLSIDGAAPVHFDSGLRTPGATFPEIKTQVTRHTNACFDTLFTIDAKPSGSLAVGGQGLALAIGPNPSEGATEVMFALAADAPVDLAVFDLTGRKVRALAHERLPAGPHFAHWDGRSDTGEPAAAGLYLVRLTTPTGTLARTAIRVH